MRATNKRRHVPAELVSQILLNLPVKSLLRFSSVSKSWNSIVSDSSFVRTHLALPGRERIAIVTGDGDGGVEASTFLIPFTSSNNPTANGDTELICPVGDRRYHVEASCRELWLVRFHELLFLWNPSIRTYQQVRKPSSCMRSWDGEFVFGLGYDSVGDDYKILKIPCKDEMFELYSLRSDSWTSIQNSPKNLNIWHCKRQCVLVSGNLHWIADPVFLNSDSTSIKSFDLSTEKFGEVGLPIYFQSSLHLLEEMIALKGMLCLTAVRTYGLDMLCLTAVRKYGLDIWAMEEYGNVRSWTKKYSIDSSHLFSLGLEFEKFLRYRPLYLYENGDLLVKASTLDWNEYTSNWNRYGIMFVYKGEKTTLQEARSCHNKDVYVYVDSLVAPSMWSR